MVVINMRYRRDGRWIVEAAGIAPESIHSVDRCAGETCVIHNPSSHHMLYWPPIFRSDTGLIERQCEHGIGHPDPDSLAYWERIYQTERGTSSGYGIHGCDGCCRRPKKDET